MGGASEGKKKKQREKGSLRGEEGEDDGSAWIGSEEDNEGMQEETRKEGAGGRMQREERPDRDRVLVRTRTPQLKYLLVKFV